jgi:hypothetical protein
LSWLIYPRLGGMNNKHLFLTILAAEKSKMKTLKDLVSGEGRPAFWVQDGCILTVSSHGGRGQGSSLGSLLLGHNPIHKGSSPMT